MRKLTEVIIRLTIHPLTKVSLIVLKSLCPKLIDTKMLMASQLGITIHDQKHVYVLNVRPIDAEINALLYQPMIIKELKNIITGLILESTRGIALK